MKQWEKDYFKEKWSTTPTNQGGEYVPDLGKSAGGQGEGELQETWEGEETVVFWRDSKEPDYILSFHQTHKNLQFYSNENKKLRSSNQENNWMW